MKQKPSPSIEQQYPQLSSREIQMIEQSKYDNKQFITITNYAFYDDNDRWAKCILDLSQIENHPKEKIHIKFYEKGFDLRIFDYINGKNYHFGATRTQCKINAKESKISFKPNKLIIWFRKNKDGDNFFSLYKTKTIGGNDDSD